MFSWLNWFFLALLFTFPENCETYRLGGPFLLKHLGERRIKMSSIVAKSPGRKKVDPKLHKPPDDIFRTIANIKGNREYAKWLDDFARTTLIPKAALLRDGLRLKAKEMGFPPPPEVQTTDD